ncbi:hypothetical protein PIGHUM_01637 [Pigmentiphaga humi]|uniref:DUF4145 domain-containing protein n=1 Tax=Pigmentiphaga humi TaxID=2478468 RepID=A0A3P4AZU6_9BURK|nr:DUF4145 domain-containing protein [Pigmentiphaga humi]VCU69574.1 hypothetical protein PIGHUM_01637 [Pigmentiphaga humi]
MSNTFPWTCPYCNRAAIITNNSFTSGLGTFNDGNKDGPLGIAWTAVTCPNPQCREYELKAKLFAVEYAAHGARVKGLPLTEWQLRPQSSAKPFPNYIPRAIISDYNEACLIRDLSPKASSTLARRCLQGIIRDFWGISRNRLIDEVNELKPKIDTATWKAIDAIRSIGNIGAHMEKDINVIVDVEPEEAQLLIDLIEILLKDWYISRHEREQHLEHIVALAASKKEEKGKSVG